jgi:hypothetical protein
MDATLIELLLLEVKRQILAADAASDADPTSYESGMISLKEMGTEYSLLLSEFSSNLAGENVLPYSHLLVHRTFISKELRTICQIV